VGSALDAFRAQQQAAEQIQARLTEVAGLLGQLRSQADALANSEDLRVVLRQEQSWLDSARRTVAEVRHWRHEEQKRYWPGVMQRWAVALVFALAASATAGAGYGWVTSPYAAELVSPRARIHLAEFIEHRLVTMTNAERRQFETLMRWDAGPKR
jgi:hypothetical protein